MYFWHKAAALLLSIEAMYTSLTLWHCCHESAVCCRCTILTTHVWLHECVPSWCKCSLACRFCLGTCHTFCTWYGCKGLAWVLFRECAFSIHVHVHVHCDYNTWVLSGCLPGTLQYIHYYLLHSNIILICRQCTVSVASKHLLFCNPMQLCSHLRHTVRVSF